MIENTETIEEKVEVQNQPVEVVEETKPEPSKPAVDRNWEEAREVLRLQKQRILELEERLAKQNQPPPQEEKDDFDGLEDDDVLPVRKAKELKKEIRQVKEEAKQIVQEYMQQQTILQDEQRMRAKHEDFDFVIENFCVPMIKNEPALAYKIQTSKNPAETAYKLAKLSDEYEESMKKQQTSPKAEKIIKNSSRPVSSNAVSSSLKTQADDFSKLSPQQIWEMSQKYARGA